MDLKIILADNISSDYRRNIQNCSRLYLFFEPLLAVFGAVRESFYVRKYLRTLRKYEFFINVNSGGGETVYEVLLCFQVEATL